MGATESDTPWEVGLHNYEKRIKIIIIIFIQFCFQLCGWISLLYSIFGLFRVFFVTITFSLMSFIRNRKPYYGVPVPGCQCGMWQCAAKVSQNKKQLTNN